jgi:hypothetical protein
MDLHVSVPLILVFCSNDGSDSSSKFHAAGIFQKILTIPVADNSS